MSSLAQPESGAASPPAFLVVTIALDPERPHILYAGTTGGAYRSTDGAKTWHRVPLVPVPAAAGTPPR